MVPIFVRLVPVDITRPATHALNAPVADRVNTRQEQRVMAAEAEIPKRVRRAPVADRANTKQEQRVLVAPLAIHNFVMLVQMVGHRILARRVNM